MKATTTLKVKLQVTEEVAQSLKETNAAYVVALNSTSQVAFEKKIFNSVALHHVTYRDVKAATGLPANLVCSARCVVAEAYKRDNTKQHKWKQAAAMRYDARTLTVKLAQEFATLATLQGRARVNLILADYHREYLANDWQIAPTATVSCRKGIWYLHLIAEKEIPESDGDKVMGVDSGIVRIATTSTGKVFKGGRIKHIRQQRFKQRRELQTARHKTPNQRKLVKRLAGKEKRTVEWLLWNVANQIVRESQRINASVIAVEDLKGIRSRIRVAKKQRLIQHGWPFASLFQKLAHVGSKVGIKVAAVDARNTSKTCHKCGHCDTANRKSQVRFVCVVCGHKTNADFNASLNIRDRFTFPECGAVTHRENSPLHGQS